MTDGPMNSNICCPGLGLQYYFHGEVRSMKIWTLLTLIVLTGPALIADEEAGRLKALMHTFQYEISKIRQALVSDQSFQKKESLQQVQQVLTNLERKTKAPPPKLIADAPGFRVNYSLLADHFQRTKKAFEHKEYDLARVRLAATTNFCASCHMQIPQKNGAFAGLS